MYDEDWPSAPTVTDEMVQAAMRAYDAADGDNDYMSLDEIRMRAALAAALAAQ